jgi:hypothetical protein
LNNQTERFFGCRVFEAGGNLDAAAGLENTATE